MKANCHTSRDSPISAYSAEGESGDDAHEAGEGYNEDSEADAGLPHHPRHAQE